MASRTLNRHLTFQMALHADGIAAVGRELGRIHDGTGSPGVFRRSDMRRARTVAAFTSDAGMEERRHRVEIIGSLDRRPHATDVATQATGIGRQIQGNFARILIGRRHVPTPLIAIPIHRRFEQEAILREQVTQAAASRANVIEQFPLASHRRVSRTLKAEPDMSRLGINTVVNSGAGMEKIGGNYILNRGTAGPRHGSVRVRLVDPCMASGTGLVRPTTSAGR